MKEECKPAEENKLDDIAKDLGEEPEVTTEELFELRKAIIEANNEIKEEVVKEPTLGISEILDRLNTEHAFVAHLLDNLEAYCDVAKAMIAKDPAQLQNESSRMFLASKKHSHEAEIGERLGFLEYYADNSPYKLTQAELTRIFALLSSSPVKSDLV